MEPKTIDEVFDRNFAIGERLNTLVRSFDQAKVDALPEGEKWTIANIVEHVSIVEENMIRICSKLLSKAQAEDKMADGAISTSKSFDSKAVEIATMKLEAPEFVQPSCEKSIDDSMAKFAENQKRLAELRTVFERFDSNTHRFPHPFLGNLSAGEWLTLIGGHKLRHIKQIEKLAARI